MGDGDAGDGMKVSHIADRLVTMMANGSSMTVIAGQVDRDRWSEDCMALLALS